MHECKGSLAFVTVKQLRAAVRLIRLDHGWTYYQLAADIARVNGDFRLSPDTLRRFILGLHMPRETGEHAIRTYVERKRTEAA